MAFSHPRVLGGGSSPRMKQGCMQEPHMPRDGEHLWGS